MLGRLPLFLICLALGFLFLKYTKNIKDFTGAIGFAEQYLGMGGTYTFFKILGVLFIIFSFAYITGHIDMLMCKYAGSLFGNSCSLTEVKG